MKLIRVGLLAFLMGVLWLTSCTRPQHGQLNQGMVTESKAIELAKEEFARRGHKVSGYVVTIETNSTGHKWIVCFNKQGAYAAPGDDHAVIVEKATGKVVFMPGR